MGTHLKINVEFTGKLLQYSDFIGYSTKFIESGSAAGDGVQRALDAGFKNVASCEAAKSWFEMCRDRFAGNKSVLLFYGKSTDLLKSMIGSTDTAAVIFLDAHPAGPLSAGHAEWLAGDSNWTQDNIIKAELAIILATDQQHVIIIDDVNGVKDGCAAGYMALIEAKWPGQYNYAFYDENLSGNLLYKDKILVAIPK